MLYVVKEKRFKDKFLFMFHQLDQKVIDKVFSRRSAKVADHMERRIGLGSIDEGSRQTAAKAHRQRVL
jgi:hypothetical protein